MLQKTDFSWTLDDAGMLTISGEGRLPDLFVASQPEVFWMEEPDRILSVVIGEGITQLGIRNFQGCTNLVHVTLPATLSRISYRCFWGCSSLEEIEIPQGKTLRFLYEPKDTDRKDGQGSGSSFRRRTGDEDGSEEIVFGMQAFWATPWALQRWGDGYVRDGVFYMAFPDADTFSVPDGVEVIRRMAFFHTPYTQIRLPDSLRMIEDQAFSNTCVEEVTLPDGITWVGESAFCESPLKRLLLPRSMRMPSRMRDIFHADAFAGTSIYVDRKSKFPIKDAYKARTYVEAGIQHFRRLRIVRKDIFDGRTGYYVREWQGFKMVSRYVSIPKAYAIDFFDFAGTCHELLRERQKDYRQRKNGWTCSRRLLLRLRYSTQEMAVLSVAALSQGFGMSEPRILEIVPRENENGELAYSVKEKLTEYSYGRLAAENPCRHPQACIDAGTMGELPEHIREDWYTYSVPAKTLETWGESEGNEEADHVQVCLLLLRQWLQVREGYRLLQPEKAKAEM